MAKIDPTIFKTYDIRGIYPDQINYDSSYYIARAFACLAREIYQTQSPKIAIGYDVRNSSPELFEGAKEGLLKEGSEIIDTGLSSTPLNYFANWFLNCDGSIMITASHNPKEYNGLKLSLKKVKALAEIDGIKKIKNLALEQRFQNKKQGTIKKIDILNDYLNYLVKEVKGLDLSSLKIALDCSNGALGPIFEKLKERLNLNYQGIFMEPDGNFPNHPPNPLKEDALVPLKNLLQTKRFDLGIIFDGDGDRFMVLTNKGKVIRSDILLGIYATHYIKKGQAKEIPCDLRVSRGVIEAIRNAGGIPLKTRVGYPFLRKKMREHQAFVGGELSGHFFWKDFSYAESALLALIRILKIILEEKKDLNELIKTIKKYYNSGEINFEVKDKEGKIKEIEKIYHDGKISKLDGLTVEYKDWWFNIRPSNTEPLLRLTIEATSQNALSEKIKELKRIILE
jgi:phosphomannomutase